MELVESQSVNAGMTFSHFLPMSDRAHRLSTHSIALMAMETMNPAMFVGQPKASRVKIQADRFVRTNATSFSRSIQTGLRFSISSAKQVDHLPLSRVYSEKQVFLDVPAPPNLLFLSVQSAITATRRTKSPAKKSSTALECIRNADELRLSLLNPMES